MSYLIYGKRLTSKKLKNGTVVGPDKTFRALTYGGVRVNKLSDAGEYAERADAQEVIDRAIASLKKIDQEDTVVFEIRKAK